MLFLSVYKKPSSLVVQSEFLSGGVMLYSVNVKQVDSPVVVQRINGMALYNLLRIGQTDSFLALLYKEPADKKLCTRDTVCLTTPILEATRILTTPIFSNKSNSSDFEHFLVSLGFGILCVQKVPRVSLTPDKLNNSISC